MKKIGTLIAGLFVALMLHAENADDIIKKHIDAMGGADKLKSLKSVKMEGKSLWGGNMEIPFVIYIKNSEAFKMEVSIQDKKMIQCVKGDSGWTVQPWQGTGAPEKMSADEVKAEKESADIGGDLFNYKDKGYKVELIGKEDMEGTEAYKLKVTKKDDNVKFIYLDASTYYILKETEKFKFQDKEVESEQLFSNYKTVDGYVFAFTHEQRAVGEPTGQVTNFEKIEINPKIDDSVFVMPKK